MATLEVHDGRGRVERVEVTRKQPVLFGSSPKCDIVLSGPDVLPFHGRVRWKLNRYKVDASPEAEYLLVNGRKMTAASFRQGDEIEIGPCRIFMIHADDDDDLPPADDKTRIQAPPLSTPSARPAPVPSSKPLPRMRPHARPNPPVDQPSSQPGPPRTVAVADSAAARLWRVLTARDRAPGQERIMTSPLVIGLAVALVALVFLSVTLNRIIARTVADRLYDRAVEGLDDGDYRNAIRRFDEFLASNRNDPRASKARVLRALANVRQFATATGASWPHALEAERAMFEQVGSEPAFRDSSTDLAELIVKTGEALADRARVSADRPTLAEAEAAKALHDRLTGESSAGLLARSRLPAKLAEARAAVLKAEVRSRALADMDAALKAGSAAQVYEARDALVLRYADLAGDRDLVARMTGANDLIRRAVKFDSTRRAAATAPRPEPLGPPVTFVLRAANTPASPANAPVVFGLADGFAYGLDGLTGAPRWQIAVGPSAPFPPRPIAGAAAALVCDARHDELVRIDARTGALVWRQPLDEPIADPPLVLGNQIIQPTPTGNLLLIDLNTGERQGRVALGLPLARSPVSDEAGQYLYAMAAQDCLFLVKRDPVECVAVEYLGHAAGSVPCPPARLARYLIVVENHTLTDSRWRVFLLEDDGARVRPVQQLAFPGWTWSTPASAGSVVWATTDRGGVSALALGSYEEKEPFRPLAKLNADPQSSGPAFALARSERELLLDSGRSGRYDLDTERGDLKLGWRLPGTDAALAPWQPAGPLVVATRQAPDGPGAALWGVDPQSGAVRWRTVLGAPWPVPPLGTPDGGLTTLGIDGRSLTIGRDLLQSGGFVTGLLPRPGDFRLPAGVHRRLEGEGVTLLIPAPHADFWLARAGASGAFRKVELPAPLAADPLFWGRDVLAPGADGRVYLLDPLTGESRAEPFVPPFDRAHPTRWRTPVRLDADTVALADQSGKVRRLSRPTAPRPRLVESALVDLGKELIADPAATTGALIVATADGRARALAARDLGPAGAWPLSAPLAQPPTAVAGHGFLIDKAGGVLALGPDGQRLWSAELQGGTAVGPPVVRDQTVWFLARDGALQRFALADGKPLDRIDAGILPSAGLMALEPDLLVPVGLGTVQTLKPPETEKP